MSALDKVVLKFCRAGKEAGLLGFDEARATRVARLGTHDKQAYPIEGSLAH